jgi:hypothetical protein
MDFGGQKLWTDHRNTFCEHQQYFFTKIAKPVTMSIVDYNDHMREYGDTLRHLQPPSRKGTKKSAEADWAALEMISEEDIRTATYDALPKEYKTHIEGQYETDFRDMDEIEFLEAMIAFEVIDKGRLALREQDKQRKKEASKKSRKRSSDAKDGAKPKRPIYKGVGHNCSQTKVKKFCKDCKESGGRYWTHDTEDCFVKDRADSRKRESNAMDAM